MLRYQMTADPKLLVPYFRIRQKYYQRELGVHNLSAEGELQDRLGVLLIVIDDEIEGDAAVVGGVRINPIMHQWNGNNCKLLMSNRRQHIEFPYPLKSDASFCQWSRLALSVAYRKGHVFKELCTALLSHSRALGFGYAVNLTGKTRSRFYRKIHVSLGHTYHTLQTDELSYEPGFAGLEHLLSITDLEQGSLTRLKTSKIASATTYKAA